METKSYFNKKQIKKAFFLLFVFLFFGSAVFAWTGPTVAPPTCPAGEVGCIQGQLLDTSSVTQTKTGGINLSTTSGYVGVGITNPEYKLHVGGFAKFENPVIVGTPTADNHAVTKLYVDSTISTGMEGSSRIAGSSDTGYLQYSGTTKTSGTLYGGVTAPSGSVRLNYDGYFYATRLYDGGVRVALSTRTITAGDGLSGGGNLTANRTLTVDSTVIRTTGDQTLGGTKTFSNPIIVGTPTVNSHAATKAYVDSTIGSEISANPTNLGIVSGTTAGPTVTSSTGTYLQHQPQHQV